MFFKKKKKKRLTDYVALWFYNTQLHLTTRRFFFFFFVFHQCLEIITSMDVHWSCTNLYMHELICVCFFSFFAMFLCWTYFIRLAGSSKVMKHLHLILMWKPPSPPPPPKCSSQLFTLNFLLHSPFYLMLIDTLFLIHAILTGMQK